MDCLKSFSLGIDVNKTYTNTATNIKNWGAAGNYHFVIVDQSSSTFKVQGFKRIDIYGVRCAGYIQTTLGPNDGAIVTDWSINFGFQGQIPLIGGFVQAVPNDWFLNTNNPQYNLGKYDTSIDFASPYTGCEGVSIGTLKVQGNNGETLNSINLDIRLQFEVFYRFEGE